ncbi:MAG: peptidylprolyl isomerase [Bauldia sp.]|nr:peptidylprolyl isomerase [Bauldia sp.]
MLEALKRRTSGFTARVVLVALAILVGLWGVIVAGGSFFGGNQNAVITVGSQVVTAAEFTSAYNQQLQVVNFYDGYTTPQQAEERYGLTDVVVSRLALEAMVLDQATKMGLGVSNQAMAARIRLDPSFADRTGAFNLAAYRTMISQQYGTEAAYLEVRRPAELQGQIGAAISPEQLTLPESYRRILWEYDNEQRDLLLALITPANLGLLPEPTEEQIAAKYADTAATAYQAPESRAVVLLQVNPGTQAQPEAITEDELRAAYTERQATFGNAETRHVFIELLASAERATAIQALLDAGRTFDQLVAAGEIAPADQGTISESYFSANPAVGAAAFSLEPGATTIVDGRFGRTLVHVAEVNAATIPAFEDVADELRVTLAQERAAVTIRDVRDQVEDARAGGTTLLEAATRFNLTPVTMIIDAAGNDAFGQRIADLPGGTTLVNAVFATDVGYADPPLAGAGGYIWYEVTAILPPHQRPLEEVREQVIADWRSDDASQRMQDLASTVINRVNAGETLTAVASSLGLTLEPVNDATRGTTPTNTLSSNALLAAFNGPSGYIAPASTTDGEGVVVVQVVDVTIPPFDPTIAPTTTEEGILAAFQQDLMQGYVRDLATEYGNIQYNQQLVRQLAGLAAAP